MVLAQDGLIDLWKRTKAKKLPFTFGHEFLTKMAVKTLVGR